MYTWLHMVSVRSLDLPLEKVCAAIWSTYAEAGKRSETATWWQYTACVIEAIVLGTYYLCCNQCNMPSLYFLL